MSSWRPFKRWFDLSASVVGGLLILPLLLVIALLIKLDSRGPALFRQQRVGLNGKVFWIYKFRTMVVDAEQQRAALASCNETDGPLFKIQADPRVTRLGRILRQFSLDEFPQLINVIKGEMSLIGPRPLPVEDWEPCKGGAGEERHLVLPGMTGLWQVSGRSDVDGGRMLELDSLYVRHGSFVLDLEILARTLVVVLGRRGAC